MLSVRAAILGSTRGVGGGGEMMKWRQGEGMICTAKKPPLQHGTHPSQENTQSPLGVSHRN